MTEAKRPTAQAVEGLEQIEPLLYTNQGNIPQKGLTRHVEWQFLPSIEACETIVFVEEWHNAAGEIVKRSFDVCVLKGVQSETEAGKAG